MSTRTTIRSVALRAESVVGLVSYFARPERAALLVPVLLSVFVAGTLLVITGGLSYVAPFVYGLF